MIRADREITDREQQLAILRDCDVCRIALNDPAAGVPYIVPLNFGVDVEDDEVYLYFHSARRGRAPCCGGVRVVYSRQNKSNDREVPP